jgi:hypothetical protein
MNAAAQTFPTKKIVMGALIAPITYAKVLMLKTIPAVIVLVASYVTLFGSLALMAANEDAGWLAALFLLWPFCIFGMVFGYTIIAETIHRAFLLGPDSIPGRGFRRWCNRDTRFFGWAIGIGGLASLAMIPGAILAFYALPMDGLVDAEGQPSLSAIQLRMQIIGLIASIPAAYVLGRIAFVLPATAVGRKPDLGWSSDVSRGYQWHTFLVVGLLPTAINTIVSILLLALPQPFGAILTVVLFVYLSVVTIAVLSFSYGFLVQAQPEKLPPEITPDGKLIGAETTNL